MLRTLMEEMKCSGRDESCDEAAETSEELSKTLQLTILELKQAPSGRFSRLELTLKQNPAVQLCADHSTPFQ